MVPQLKIKIKSKYKIFNCIFPVHRVGTLGYVIKRVFQLSIFQIMQLPHIISMQLATLIQARMSTLTCC